MASTLTRILVVCTGNSARSIMAEALFHALGEGVVVAASAGSRPTGRIHPLALEQIGQLPVDPVRYGSKDLATAQAQSPHPYDLVITVCDHAAEHCGLLPGDPRRLHWGLPDPAAHLDAAEAKQAFSACFVELRQRITALLPSLQSGA